jgi:hypothetical protein
MVGGAVGVDAEVDMEVVTLEAEAVWESESPPAGWLAPFMACSILCEDGSVGMRQEWDGGKKLWMRVE